MQNDKINPVTSQQATEVETSHVPQPADDLELAEIIDAPALQSLMNDFYELAHIPMSIVDNSGNVLVGVGWQSICTDFHRRHPQTCKYCIESDTQLSKSLQMGEFRLYRCKNNMWDIATPLTTGGRRVGSVLCGQFFFDDEELDLEFFRRQAEKYGFNEEEYLAALKAVPRLSRESVNKGMEFLLKLAQLISRLTYTNANLVRSLHEQETLTLSLKESEQRLSRTQEIAHLGSWELDLVRNKLSWSDEAYRIFGLQPQEFAATYEAFLDVVHPEDRAAVDEAYSDSLTHGHDTYEIEHRIIRRATGEVRWVREKCEHVRDGSGKIVMSVGMTLDITEQRLAQEAKQRLLRRFELLAETAGQLLQSSNPQKAVNSLCRSVMEHLDCQVFSNFMLDEKSGRLHLNAYCGVSQEQARRLEWMDQSEMVSGRVVRDGASLVIENIQSSNDPRVELLKSYEVKAYACFPIMGPNGQAMGTLAFGTHTREAFSQEDLSLMKAVTDQVAVAIGRMRDEQTLRRTAKELLRSNNDLQQFAYIASHDLQEPLRQVRAFVQLLHDRHEGQLQGKAADYMRYISEGAARMSSLVQDLLSYSRVGSAPQRCSNISCEDALKAALANLELSIKEAGATVTYDQLPKVVADPTLLCQLLQNLISNAIKFSRKGVPPQIQIGARTEENSHVLWVQDNGIGIEPQYRDKVFLIFQRLHGRDQYPGTGIGLAICKKIVEQHGGKIWIESCDQGGCRFCFSLPRANS